jgi:hypothetical protein
MNTSSMIYPFGRCARCVKEFYSELRNEHEITYCPWCGEAVDGCFAPSAKERPDDIYCEDCGIRIYERDDEGGSWIRQRLAGREMIKTSNAHGKQPGVCSGPCERELCGLCGDWDDEGCCPKCHAEPCEACPDYLEAYCRNCFNEENAKHKQEGGESRHE